MEEPQMGVELQTRVHTQSQDKDLCSTNQPQSSRFRHYKWWIRVISYIVFLIAGQSAATLLGRLYYDEGGNSKGVSCAARQPTILTLVLLYFGFGLLLTGDNMMYSYGLLYVPVSTYSLLCATQLAFNAVFSFFLNSQKFTPFILNSVILLAISAAFLAVNSDSENTSSVSKGKDLLRRPGYANLPFVRRHMRVRRTVVRERRMEEFIGRNEGIRKREGTLSNDIDIHGGDVTGFVDRIVGIGFQCVVSVLERD
ncbi:Intron maturase isoform 1 [Hibiscus syriacus]|uniref:Intron maturase isoform 1 n=1 Tax=Hibiscus syriacus TaxID=106335 RepID=A0A6A2Y8X3_HIBSY|nr:Intron maturase isoform 1 [Hibiscus syriacus]